jgi:chemotaxis signal transduction protein
VNEVLIFGVGSAEWALPAQKVRQVLPAGPVTRLPGASPPLRGLVAWRTQVLPLFALGTNAEQWPSIVDRGSLLVIEVEGELAALAVDRVKGFAPSRPPAADTARHENDSAVLVDGQAVHLLDLERILDEQ